MAGGLLVSIIISYKTRFKSLVPIFIQFLVTILYSFFLYILVCMWGWKQIHIIIIITILINLIICGYEGRRIMGHRDSCTRRVWPSVCIAYNRRDGSFVIVITINNICQLFLFSFGNLKNNIYLCPTIAKSMGSIFIIQGILIYIYAFDHNPPHIIALVSINIC